MHATDRRQSVYLGFTDHRSPASLVRPSFGLGEMCADSARGQGLATSRHEIPRSSLRLRFLGVVTFGEAFCVSARSPGHREPFVA